MVYLSNARSVLSKQHFNNLRSNAAEALFALLHKLTLNDKIY